MSALHAPFDLVVASDCIYKQDLFSPLIGMLQRVALCCTMLQCVAVFCSVLQHMSALHAPFGLVVVSGPFVLLIGVLQRVAVCCCVLQCVAVCCSVL